MVRYTGDRVTFLRHGCCEYAARKCSEVRPARPILRRGANQAVLKSCCDQPLLREIAGNIHIELIYGANVVGFVSSAGKTEASLFPANEFPDICECHQTHPE